MKDLILNACETVRYWQNILTGYDFCIDLQKEGLVFVIHEDYVNKNLNETLYSYGKKLEYWDDEYYRSFKIPISSFQKHEENENYWKEFKKIELDIKMQ